MGVHGVTGRGPALVLLAVCMVVSLLSGAPAQAQDDQYPCFWTGQGNTCFVEEGPPAYGLELSTRPVPRGDEVTLTRTVFTPSCTGGFPPTNAPCVGETPNVPSYLSRRLGGPANWQHDFTRGGCRTQFLNGNTCTVVVPDTDRDFWTGSETLFHDWFLFHNYAIQNLDGSGQYVDTRETGRIRLSPASILEVDVRVPDHPDDRVTAGEPFTIEVDVTAPAGAMADADAVFDPLFDVYDGPLEAVDPIVPQPFSLAAGETVTLSGTYRARGQEVTFGAGWEATGDAGERVADHDYHYLEVTPPVPRASFTVAPGELPGQFTFTSTSTGVVDPQLDWSFGDGISGSGQQVVHTYQQPGTYPVTLTVTEGLLSDVATDEVVVDPAHLAVQLQLLDGHPRGLQVDQPFRVRVRASASDGVGSVTGVTFDAEDVLELLGDPGSPEDGGPLLEVTDAPELPDGSFSIQPGGTGFDGTWTITPRAQGTGRIQVGATGTNAEGGEETRQDGVDVLVGDAFAVVLSVDPSEVRLRPAADEGEDGSPPPPTEEEDEPRHDPVALTVRITNTQAEPLRAIIQGVDPRSEDGSPILSRITVDGDFPHALADPVPPGESAEVSFDVRAVADGEYDFRALVTGALGSDPNAGTLTGVGEGAPLTVVPDKIIGLELFVQEGDVERLPAANSYLVPPGGDVDVHGTMANLTASFDLRSDADFQRTTALNLAGGEVVWRDFNTVSIPNALDPAVPTVPVIGSMEIEAGSSAQLQSLLLTTVDGAGQGRVEWTLPAVTITNRRTGESREATIDDFDLDGLGDDPPDVVFDAAGHVTTTLVQDRRTELGPSVSSPRRFGYFIEGALLSAPEMMYDTYDSLATLGRALGNLTAEDITNTLGQAGRAIIVAGEYMATTWEEMTAEERQAFVRSVVHEVLRRQALLVGTGQPLTPGEVEAIGNAANDLIYSFFGDVEDAYARDDMAAAARAMGGITGRSALETLMAFVPADEFARFATVAEARRLLKAEEATTSLLTSVERGLQTIDNGPVTHATARGLWGLGRTSPRVPGDPLDELTVAQRIMGQLGIRGYLRERNPISIRHYEEGLAVFKPEPIKAKGVSDADIALGVPERWRGLTMVFYPEPDSVLLPRLRAEGRWSEEEIEVILARAAQRRKEYEKRAPEMFRFQRRGEVDLTLNYRDNGLPQEGAPQRVRAYENEIVPADPATGAPQLVVARMADEAGQMKYVTGDIDWVHFSFLDGSPLDPATARIFYRLMYSYGAGMQHPETFTWIREGLGFFDDKVDQLSEYLSGAKALLEVSPDGLRAVRINQSMSRLAREGRDNWIYFHRGAKGGIVPSAEEIGQVALLLEQQAVRAYPLVAPFLWYRGASGGQGGAVGGCDWSYGQSEGAVLVRQEADGTLSSYDGSGWQPFTPACAPPGQAQRQSGAGTGGTALELVPMSSLDGTAPAGATTVVVADLPAQWPDELDGRVSDWFGPGDTVVLDPGAGEQRRTVTAVAPTPDGVSLQLTLDRPLDAPVDAERMVAVLPAALGGTVSTTPGAATGGGDAPAPGPTGTPGQGGQPTLPTAGADDVEIDVEVIHVPLADSADGNSEVAIHLSRLTTPTGTVQPRQATTEVLLASEQVFADGLASGGLQATSPLLLTDPTSLEPEVLAEIQRLAPARVRILGGEAAVAPGVEEALVAAGFEVVRTAGASRVETAAAIAELLRPQSALVVRAHPDPAAQDPTQAFADSLAAGAWAAAAGRAVLLTAADALSPAARAAIAARDLDRVDVVGGEAAVGAGVLGDLRDLVGVAARVSGPTRVETAVAVAEARGDLPVEAVVVVDGQRSTGWAAGVASASYAARTRAPVLLVAGDVLPEATAALLQRSGATRAVCAASATACDQVAAVLSGTSGGGPSGGGAADRVDRRPGRR